MVLLTRVLSASSGNTRLNTLTYVFDPSYGVVYPNQSIQITGFVAHTEFNLISAVIDSVNTGSHSFTVVRNTFPTNISETPVVPGSVSGFIDVTVLQGADWANDTGTTAERVGDSLSYQFIGKNYVPPNFGVPVDPTYVLNNGAPTITPVDDIITSFQFNVPIPDQQVIYSNGFSANSISSGGQVVFVLPDVRGRYSYSIAPAMNFGIAPGLVVSILIDDQGQPYLSASFMSASPHFNPGDFFSFYFNGDGNTDYALLHETTPIISRQNTGWSYPSDSIYIEATALTGLLTSSVTMSIQIITFGVATTFSGNPTTQSSSGYGPTTTTFALSTPVLNGGDLILPGWENLTIYGNATYSVTDIQTHPIVVTIPQEVYGNSSIGITFDGNANTVGVGKVSENDPFSYELSGQVIKSPSTNITIYCSSGDFGGIETQIGYRGVTGTWSNGGSTVTISGSDYSSHVIVPFSTYIVESGYFSPNTIVNDIIPSPPNYILNLSKPALQAGTNHGFELRYFTRTTTQTPAQFVMTGYSLAGYSGGVVQVVSYSAIPSYVSLPLNVFLDPSQPAYPIVAPYIAGNGSSVVNLSIPGGIRSVYTTPLPWAFYGVYNAGPVSSISTNLVVNPAVITLTPDTSSPTFQLVRYQPFSYQYALVGYNTEIQLQVDPASSNISNYIKLADPGLLTGSFSDTTGFTTTYQNQPVVLNAILDGGIVGTISNSMTVTDFLIQATPYVPGYTIQLYKYESFSNAFSIPSPTSLVLKTTGSSSEVLTFITPATATSNVLFSSTAGYQISYASPLVLSLNAVTASNVVVSTIPISVPVGAGRFYSPMPNSNYTFYVGENLTTTYPSAINIQFLTYVPLNTVPFTTPTALPNGISFTTVDSNTFQLQGTPSVQTTRQNYLVFGSNSANGKIVTTTVSIQVKAPRISVSGGPSVIANMQPDTPISPSTFTAVVPASSYGTSNFYYNWNSNLPDGVFFQDINGSNVNPGVYTMFPPSSDTSNTIVIAGTPTIAAATSLVNAGLSNYTILLTGNTRNPVLNSPAVEIELSFGEVVLFTGTTIPSLYEMSPLTSNTLIFKAGSYFPSTSSIKSIEATNLPPGLSLTTDDVPNYVNGFDYSDGVYVSGTPTDVNLTPDPTIIVASNRNGTSRTSSVSIPVLPDAITFEPPTPPENYEFTFIVSRPSSTDYPSGIKFVAKSAASQPITSIVSLPDLGDYGLTLASDGTLSGTPTSPLDPTLVEIVATDSLATTGVRNVYITIQPDVYTFNSLPLKFIQNKTISPTQVVATTLSERQVQFYGSMNLPSGLSLSPTGVLTGTPLDSGNPSFDVVASTGYDKGSTTYSTNILPDNILTLLLVSPLTVPAGLFRVDAFRSVTYSGWDAPTSYVVGSVSPANITLSMTNDVLSGNLTGGSGSYTFTVRATYQNVTADTVVSLTIANGVGVFTIGTTGSLVFTTPSITRFSGFQYVPIQNIRVQATGGSGFVYYYVLAESLLRGLSLITDPTGVYATITGTPAEYASDGSPIVVYAKNDTSVTSVVLTLVVTTPFFVNPTSAAAYTALLRNTVEENAAHNSEDNKVFPQSDALRGPLLAPPAPDEVVDHRCKKC